MSGSVLLGYITSKFEVSGVDTKGVTAMGEKWHVHGNPGRCYVVTDDNDVIAFEDELTWERAHLMAAAPLLLEALRDLERTAGQAAEFDDPVRARARQAITTAAGPKR